MKPNLEKRLATLEEAADIVPRVHFNWRDSEGDDIEAEIAGMIASGRAKVGDRFNTIG
jgi:hypothetical protein